jgi:two-component system, sensor histidine kinase and response regulator
VAIERYLKSNNNMDLDLQEIASQAVYEDKFRQLITESKFGTIVHQNGKLVFVNNAAAEMHGYASDEIVGDMITDFIAPQDVPRILDMARARLDGESVPDQYEYMALRKDGSTFPAQLGAQTVDWLGKPAILCSVIDISDRKRAEAAETRFGRIIERSLNEIYMFDPETLVFTQVNRGARTNLGYSMKELQHLTAVSIKPLFNLKSFEEAVEPLKNKTLDKLVFETVHRRKDGSDYDVEVHLELMSDEEPPVFVAIIKDITSQNKTKRELELAAIRSEQANQAKSEFLSNMSHELRTPMNGVLGMADIVLRSDLPVNTRKSLSIIKESGETLLSLLNDILDLSKIEAGKMEVDPIETDVTDLLSSVVSLVASQIEEKGLSFRLDIGGAMVSTRVMIDPTRVRQILTNLLSNAIKFTDDGSITLSMSQKLAFDGRVETRWEVSDTGIGLAEDQHSQIFKSFTQADQSTTRQYGGTGLGLSISKQLAELMGGQIGVTSEYGKGSTFWFTVVSDKGS